jgi:hypothetical protein
VNSDLLLSVILGIILGGALAYFVIWHLARKIEALVPGGLKAWDEYDIKADHASPTGRTVTS